MAGLVKDWFRLSTPYLLKTPPQPPDMNVIEHLWDNLDQKIRKRNFSSNERLNTVLKDELERRTAEYTNKLVESMRTFIISCNSCQGKSN